MRKYFVCMAAAAAVTLIGPTALAVAHPAAHAQQTKRDFVVIKGRHSRKSELFVQRHTLRNTTFAHAAACTAGNYGPNYCTAPTWNTLFGAFGQNAGTATYGSNSSSTCRALGYSSAPCGVYTTTKNTLIVAFVAADGPSTGGQTLSVTSTTASGGTSPVTFHKVASENAGLGDSEVWYADASAIIPSTAPIFVTATASEASGKTKYDVSLQVVPFNNAITAGANGPQGTGIGNSAVAFSSKGTPTVSLNTLGSDSLVFAEANDWKATYLPTPVSGQTAIGVADNNLDKTFYTQYTNSPQGANGSKVTIADTSPTNNPFNLVAVEIL
jgi:hypothetical protein